MPTFDLKWDGEGTPRGYILVRKESIQTDLYIYVVRRWELATGSTDLLLYYFLEGLKKMEWDGST